MNGLLADWVLPAVVAAVVLGLGVFALVLFRGYEALARRALARAYVGLAVQEPPAPGDVVVTYATYHGLIAWFTQTPHRAALPPDDARVLLGRLLRFNLTWGLLTYGMLFILPLSFLNYSAQRRAIVRQAAAGG